MNFAKWWIQNVSAPLSFITDAHNELQAFYTGKGNLLKKTPTIGGSGRSPFNFRHRF